MKRSVGKFAQAAVLAHFLLAVVAVQTHNNALFTYGLGGLFAIGGVAVGEAIYQLVGVDGGGRGAE